VSTMSPAPTFSLRCLRDFAPGIGTIKAPARAPRAIGQAMESWASVAFFRCAMSSSAKRSRRFSRHWRCQSEAAARGRRPPPFPPPWAPRRSTYRVRARHRPSSPSQTPCNHRFGPALPHHATTTNTPSEAKRADARRDCLVRRCRSRRDCHSGRFLVRKSGCRGKTSTVRWLQRQRKQARQRLQKMYASA
jgi:hypothetical protein